MRSHVFFPHVDLLDLELMPAHKDWLSEWLEAARANAEEGDVAASTCLQGAFCEAVLHGSDRTDWCGIFDEYLTVDGLPIAYSEKYGQRLYKFNDWRQTPVHAVHSRWWVETFCNQSGPDYIELIESFIQPSGWIYNPDVSPTCERNRIRSELMMNLAMGLEILSAAGRTDEYKERIEANVSAVACTPFLSAEAFRLAALRILDSLCLMPTGVDAVINANQTKRGYCDFSLEAKKDDYMGTAKRTGRDATVSSPLAALHAYALSRVCDEAVQQVVERQLGAYAAHLRDNPLDIPAFTIRDLPTHFGTDVSPMEVIAASAIIVRF